ncbi:30S ribosomal protein S3 [archaeon]|nr:30S ribosomal protein S3 [archaeon]
MALEEKFIQDNLRKLEVKEYLLSELSRAGIGEINIQRTPLGTRVILHARRPGIVIGKKGIAIRKLTTILRTRFGLQNPQVEVNELEIPELNPVVMAKQVADGLERGINFRRAAYTALRQIRESGARGVEITISGKLTGERSKTVKFMDGFLKHCGEPAIKFVRIGYAIAAPKPGVIGVKVKIMPPGVKLPDDIEIRDIKFEDEKDEVAMGREEVKEIIEEIIEQEAEAKEEDIAPNSDEVEEEKQKTEEDKKEVE